MNKELVEKLINDEKFKIFCSQVDLLKVHGCSINTPFETALLLYDVGIDFLKGEKNLDAIHQAAVEFLKNGKMSVGFYDYMISVTGST